MSDVAVLESFINSKSKKKKRENTRTNHQPYAIDVKISSETVFVVTYDGRTLMGELKGFDQTCTLILKKTVERIIHKDESTEEVPLGLYILRVDLVSAVVGEMDQERDDSIEWEHVRAIPMLGMNHGEHN
ncbi:hypothetical protein HK100_000965 [Physocladia obscura]|uniref:LSM2-LSM8 complex subunit LSM8 n=1 Tax=Physocladia obscura TaxID=109957 RepID=A0AAD5SZ69_9FUNG|nr:hypothetical protein HK100_000965 [Physocladia obscura]